MDANGWTPLGTKEELIDALSAPPAPLRVFAPKEIIDLLPVREGESAESYIVRLARMETDPC